MIVVLMCLMSVSLFAAENSKDDEITSLQLKIFALEMIIERQAIKIETLQKLLSVDIPEKDVKHDQHITDWRAAKHEEELKKINKLDSQNQDKEWNDKFEEVRLYSEGIGEFLQKEDEKQIVKKSPQLPYEIITIRKDSRGKMITHIYVYTPLNSKSDFLKIGKNIRQKLGLTNYKILFYNNRQYTPRQHGVMTDKQMECWMGNFITNEADGSFNPVVIMTD